MMDATVYLLRFGCTLYPHDQPRWLGSH